MLEVCNIVCTNGRYTHVYSSIPVYTWTTKNTVAPPPDLVAWQPTCTLAGQPHAHFEEIGIM